MSVTFRQVERDEEVEALAHMAYHIWNEYWPAIIGQAQTDYMVEKFQSLNAFRTDIADNGYEYFFIMQHEDETPHELGAATHGADIHDQGDTVAGRVNDDVESDRDDELAHDTEDFARTAAVPRIVGYTGGHVEADTNRFFISKIYLLKEHRGEGLCSATIRFYERLARERGLDARVSGADDGNIKFSGVVGLHAFLSAISFKMARMSVSQPYTVSSTSVSRGE